MTSSNDNEITNILLVEYQAAQASAEHHDNLLWTVTSIIWGTSLILIGFVFDSEADQGIITTIAILGIVLVLTIWRMMWQFNSLKRQKYIRCKEIEFELGMKNHSSTEHKAGSQRKIYGFIMLLFIAVWFYILWNTWRICL